MATIPSGPSAKRTNRCACWRLMTSFPQSRLSLNCRASRVSVSGDFVSAPANNFDAPGRSVIGASAARCSPETFPVRSNSSAPGMSLTTFAMFCRCRASLFDVPVLRDSAVVVSRSCGIAATSNAIAASAWRRTRSISRSPSSISRMNQPSGRITGTSTHSHGCAPRPSRARCPWVCSEKSVAFTP